MILNTYSLPYEDIVNDSSSTEHYSQTYDHWGHYCWSLIEVEECK